MVPGRKNSMPVVYGDTPSFLGCDVIHSEEEISPYDIIISGVPWEGTITWGTYSGCELAPKTIRHASARYGAFLPEYEVNAMDYLKLADWGDVSVNPNDAQDTMQRVYQRANAIYQHGAIPIFIGGDHSYTPQAIRALGSNKKAKIGVFHFDTHLDNTIEFGKDKYPRCGPFHQIYQLPNVRTDSIVHFGIHGPRNSPSQLDYARETKVTVFTMRQIRQQGFEQILARAIDIVYNSTDAVYVSICSDIVDRAYNPGGPIDFGGLIPDELFDALHILGQKGIAGLDYVEIYPLQDIANVSSHLACWCLIHALVGMALKKRCQAAALNPTVGSV